MLHDPRVRVVSFTGSTEVGRKLLHEAADNVVKPAMELGGNAPFIVFDDADIDAAIEGAMIAKMRNMGEACTAANRFYVHEKVHDAFAAKLTEKMAALKMGNGLQDGVALGPLVNAEARDKVKELVEDAVKKGAKVLTGGKAPDGKGYFYPATVLTDVPDGADMLREEIFGPVAAIQTFKAEDEVIARANDTEYGLVAYLYTQGPQPRPAGLREARLRHDRAQPRPRLRSGGAVRRHQAERHRPRRRARRHDGVPGDAIRLGELVSRASESADMDILMPQLGETVAEGKITTWFKAVGDAVKPGDNLFEIETDKVSMEVPATSAGTLTEIRVAAGEVAPVGAVVAIVAGAGGEARLPPPLAGEGGEGERGVSSRAERVKSQRAPSPPSPASGGGSPAARVAPLPSAAASAAPIMLDPFREVRTPERNWGPARLASGATVTPLARRLAGEAGIDLARIVASGPHGRIVARDVEKAIASAPAAGAPRCGRRRRRIASRRSIPRAATRRCRSIRCGGPSRPASSRPCRPSRISI